MDIKKVETWLKIPKTNIDAEMRVHPSRLFYIGTLLNKATRKVDLCEKSISAIKVAVAENYRKIYQRRGEKLSETKLNDKVKKDAKLKIKEKELIDLKFEVGMLKTAMQAMINKSDMLIGMSYTRRKEMDYGIRKRATVQ